MERLNNDILKLWLLWSFMIPVVYVFPNTVSNFIFIILIFITIRNTNYNYFWIAFWVLIFNSPGNLFSDLPISESQQLPVLSYGSLGYNFSKFFPVIFLIKILITKPTNKKQLKNVFKNDFNLIFALFCFYFFYSVVIGMDIGNIINTFCIFLYLTLFISFPRILNYDAIKNLDKLLFSVCIIAFFSQIFTFILGFSFLQIVLNSFEIELNVGRTVYSSYILLYCFVKVLYYLSIGKSENFFSKNYLLFILFLCMISILLSATRGWIIAMIICFIIFSFNYGFSQFKNLLVSFLIFPIISFLLYSNSVTLKTQIDNVFSRLSTVNQIYEGDITIGGSLYRVTDRAPKLLKEFYKSPFLGYGFSSVYWENRDRHVGHVLLLLNLGVFGYIILNFFFLKWILNLNRISRFYRKKSIVEKGSLSIFSIGLLFIYIIHSSTHYYWGFDLELAPMITFALIISNIIIISNQKISNIK